MKNYKILQICAKFHDISFNTLFFKFNFEVFHYLLLLLSMLSKVYDKILVSFEPIKIFEISDSAMAKVEKANIAVTYP